MRFTPYQIIILVAVICCFLLMYTGRAGIDVLLFLCGVALLLAAGVSNRGVVVRIAARGFEFGMNLLPSRTPATPPPLTFHQSYQMTRRCSCRIARNKILIRVMT